MQLLVLVALSFVPSAQSGVTFLHKQSDQHRAGQHASHTKKWFPGQEDDQEGYEYGDREAAASDADSSDYSAEQFLATDDGRDPISKTANFDAKTMAQRQAILASEDHFDSESTPGDNDDFMQVADRSVRRGRAAKKWFPGQEDDQA